MRGRFFRFSYHTSNRVVHPHHLRDGGAFSELAAVLFSQGYGYGGLLLNYPGDPSNILSMDVSSLTSSDLLVLMTRPPLDDTEADRRRQVRRSYTSLENLLFKALRQYLKVCERSRVILADSLAAKLPPAFASRAAIDFRVYEDRKHPGAWYTALSKNGFRWEPDRSRNLTAVYMLYLPQVWPGGPGLITSFGMGGTENLIWAYLMRTQFPHLLDSPRFVLAEMTMQRLPQRPTDLSFADHWQVAILLDQPLPISP